MWITVKGHDFYQREDDKPEKVAYRINLQMESIRPILDYYEERGLLHRVDGQQAIDKVYEDIRQICPQWHNSLTVSW